MIYSMSNKNYLVVDIECTTTDDGTFLREEMETIEIGAVLVDNKTLKIVDEYDVIIKPVRNPILKPFCIQLTTITQDMVDVGLSFQDAIVEFSKKMFSIKNDVIFASWGHFDKWQLQNDFTFHKIDYSMPDEHINLKVQFSQVQGRKKQYGLSRAVNMCGLQWEGQHHRGIDDAKNTARLLPWIIGNERIKT
jgi:inhibitor of KinA sporulation pathway (predicted exonuclease)